MTNTYLIFRDHYEKSFFKRMFNKKPIDTAFKRKLASIKSCDILVNALISFLIKLDDSRNIKIEPEKIIPYGMKLQRRIITSGYKI